MEILKDTKAVTVGSGCRLFFALLFYLLLYIMFLKSSIINVYKVECYFIHIIVINSKLLKTPILRGMQHIFIFFVLLYRFLLPAPLNHCRELGKM